MVPRQRSHPFYRVVIALKGATQRTHGQGMKETMSLLPPQGMVLRSTQAAHPPHPERVEMRSNHAAHPPVAGGVVQRSNEAALPLHQVQVEQRSIQAAHPQHEGGMSLVYMTWTLQRDWRTLFDSHVLSHPPHHSRHPRKQSPNLPQTVLQAGLEQGKGAW